MKSAGALASKPREYRALAASLAAMLLVLLVSSVASAQSAVDTTASDTWRIAAASAAASPTASGPSNMVATPLDNDPTPSGATEIAPASPDASQQQSASGGPDSNDGSEVARYQEEQSGMPPEQLKALQEFDSEGELSTPFGMQLREAKRSLKTGEEADGLLITTVAKGSPAAAVGLRPYNHTVHDALAAAAMVGAVFSGGLSVVVIPALDYMQVGESYDMIIGVDGSRVTNFLDFQDRMHDLQPGEVVYLSILRDGKRVQVTMPVPTTILQATN